MKKNIRLIYVRDEKNNPIGCVAIQKSKLNKWVKYAASMANPNDKFDKEIGRLLALGRLLESPVVIKTKTEFNHHDLVRLVFWNIFNRGIMNKRLLQFVDRWLHAPVNDAPDTSKPSECSGKICDGRHLGSCMQDKDFWSMVK